MNKIETKNLSFAYIKKPMLYAGVNFLTQKNVIFVMGEQGSGKTTLLENLCGLNDEYLGKILLNGNEPRNYSRYISYIPAMPVLLQNKTVKQNLEFACDALGVDYSSIEQDEWVKNNLNKKAKKLSDIDQFLLMVKRSNIKNPKFIFVDFDEKIAGEQIDDYAKIIEQNFVKSDSVLVVAVTPTSFQKLQNLHKNCEILYIKCPNIEKFSNFEDFEKIKKYAPVVDYLGQKCCPAKVVSNQNGYFLQYNGAIKKIDENHISGILSYFEVNSSADVLVYSISEIDKLSDKQLDDALKSGEAVIFDAITQERLN